MPKKDMGQNEEEILLEIVNKIEEVLKAFKENFDCIQTTRDYHTPIFEK